MMLKALSQSLSPCKSKMSLNFEIIYDANCSCFKSSPLFTIQLMRPKLCLLASPPKLSFSAISMHTSLNDFEPNRPYGFWYSIADSLCWAVLAALLALVDFRPKHEQQQVVSFFPTALPAFIESLSSISSLHESLSALKYPPSDEEVLVRFPLPWLPLYAYESWSDS